MNTKHRDRNRRVPTGDKKTRRRSRALSAAMPGLENCEESTTIGNSASILRHHVHHLSGKLEVLNQWYRGFQRTVERLSSITDSEVGLAG
jgi:hypothetical protein